MLPYVCMPPYVHMPPGVYTPHMSPYSCASVHSQRLLHVVGVVRGPLTCWILPLHPPVWRCPLQFTPPTHLLASLCIDMFQGYLYVICVFFLYVRGLRGVPICWGFWWGISTWHVHMLIRVHFCSLLCLMFLLWLQLLLLQLW